MASAQSVTNVSGPVEEFGTFSPSLVGSYMDYIPPLNVQEALSPVPAVPSTPVPSKFVNHFGTYPTLSLYSLIEKIAIL